MQSTLYTQIAESLQSQIREGALKVGERIPSVRRQAKSTALVLQPSTWPTVRSNKGWIEARPKVATLSNRFHPIPGDSLSFLTRSALGLAP